MTNAMQKRLAAQVMKCSPNRVRFDTEKLDEIKQAITKHDIRGLVSGGAIYEKPERGVSRSRARFAHKQRTKGRRKGVGTRKGSKNARLNQKRVWIEKIRAQKALLLTLKENKTITPQLYRRLYMSAKGGFFRSVRHIKLYINEQIKK
ncbi:MAG: 50S ribosomal protein L19e [Candidatus Woesearchaeota archaeon]